jgi:hypothetical protein
MTVLDLLFFAPEQWRILLCVATFLALSWGIGRNLNAGGVLASAFGFMILAAGTSLTLLVFRQTGLDITWFGPASAGMVGALILLLRLALPPLPAPSAPANRLWLIGTILVLVLVLWTLRIIQLSPSASLSSHHGWYPLYIEGSFELGRFARVEDFAFGNGYLASIFYNLDLMGMVALGKWLGPFSAWQAYSAGSTLAALLSVAIVAESLRSSRTALVVYGLMVLALLATDYLYRTTLARNWGDALLYLGGTLILTTVSTLKGVRNAALWSAAAAIFLVTSRHYGAFYAGVIMIVGYLASWRIGRDGSLKPWILLGVTLLILSAREIVCILQPPSPYYPGAKLLDVAAPPASLLWIGTLNDLGLLTGDKPAPWLIAPRNLYLLAVAAVLALWWRKRELSLSRLLAPLGLLILPQVLQHALQYRSSPDYSKTTVIALHVFAWYPALAAGIAADRLGWRSWSPRWLLAGGTVLLSTLLVVVGLGAKRANLPIDQGPTALLDSVFTLYRDHNTDLNVARLLRESQGEDAVRDFAQRPILYLHYEPGLALRYYVGGSMFCDYDFWGPTVQQQATDSADLEDLIQRLGYPSIYLSYGRLPLYSRYNLDFWQRFADDFTDIEQAPWMQSAISWGPSLLLIPKRPPETPLPACPSRRDHHHP